jgi:hypothetical protein
MADRTDIEDVGAGPRSTMDFGDIGYSPPAEPRTTMHFGDVGGDWGGDFVGPPKPAAEPPARKNPFPPMPPGRLIELFDQPFFQELPYEKRRNALSDALSAVYDFGAAQPGFDEKSAKFGQLAQLAYGKLDAEHTPDEKFLEGGRRLWDFTKGFAKDAGTVLYAGLQDPKVGPGLKEGFLLGLERYSDAANHLKDKWTSDEDNKLKDSLTAVKQQIDEGKAPITDPAKFTGWLQGESNKVLDPQQKWTAVRLGDYGMRDDTAALHMAKDNELATPHNAGLVAAYVKTRDPAIWTQLEKNLATTPLAGSLGDSAKKVMQSESGQILDRTFGEGASEHLLSASDPLMVASFLVPAARGVMIGKATAAAAAGTTLAGRALVAAKSAAWALPEQAALGAATTLGHDPEASAGEVGRGATEMMVAGTAMHAAGAVGGEAVRAVKGRLPVYNPPEGAPVETPTGPPGDNGPSGPPVLNVPWPPPTPPTTPPGEVPTGRPAAPLPTGDGTATDALLPPLTRQTETDPQGTVPETPDTLQAQAAMVTAGTRPSMLFPGAKASEVPAELQPVEGDGTALHENEAGTFRYRPDQIEPHALDALVAAGEPGLALGLSEGAKPEGAEHAVTLRDRDGTELATEAVTPETAPAAAQALGRQSLEPQTDTVSVETPGQVLAGRTGGEPPVDTGPGEVMGGRAEVSKPTEFASDLDLRHLPPEERAAGAAFADRIGQDVEGAKAEYRRRFGNHISADNARELDPAWMRSKEDRQRLSAAVAPAAGKLAKMIYDEDVARLPPGNVVLLAGGQASGKTTAVQGTPYIKNADVVYDNTFSNRERARDSIEKALAGGHQVSVVYVHKPLDAAVRGAIDRAASENGRVEPAPHVAALHQAAQRTFLEAAKEFGKRPGVDFVVVDASKPKARSLTVEQLKEIAYREPLEKLKEQAIVAADDHLARAHPNQTRAFKEAVRGRVFGPDSEPGKPPSVRRGDGETSQVGAETLPDEGGRQGGPVDPAAPAAAEAPKPAGMAVDPAARAAAQERANQAGMVDFKAILQGLGEGGREAKRFVEELAHIPKFTQFRESVNQWVSTMQQSALKVRDLQKDVEKTVPNALRREAITNYVQAGGDMTKLQAWESKSKGRLAKGYEIAQSLTADEIALAGRVRQFYDEVGRTATKEGVLRGWKADYVNKVWKDRLFASKLTRTFAFGKHATHENFFEGEQEGLVPATKDASKLMGLYVHELHKTIATRRLIKDLTTKADEKDGRPLAAPLGGVIPKPADGDIGPPGGSNVLVLPSMKGKVRFGEDVDGQPNMVEIGDYKRLNHPALAKWRFIDKDADTGRISVILGELGLHPEIAAHMKNALGESELKRWMKEPANSRMGWLARKAARGGEHLNSFVKQTMLSLSPFHIVQEGTHALGHKVNPFSNIPRVDPDNPAHMDAMNHGLMLGGDDIAMRQFVEGLGNAPMLERIPGVGPIVKAVSDFTFHKYIPGLKLKTYDHILRRNMDRFKPELAAGKVTESDVKYLSAKQTNNAYGHLNYKDMGRNPTFQHILRLTLLAPDFLEARLKFTGDAVLRGKVGREQKVALATLAIGNYVVARTVNAALNNGDPKWKIPFGVQVGNRVFEMRTVPADWYNLLKDVRVFNNGKFDPSPGESGRKFIAGRLSPLLGSTIQMATGRNYRGEKVQFSQTMGDAVLKAVPMSTRMAPGLRDLTQSTKDNPVSPWEQFAGTIGLHISRYSPITELQVKAGNFAEASGHPNTGAYPVSPYRNLRFALEDQDWDHARAEIKALGQGTTPKKVAEGFKRSVFHPYTGKNELDERFVATLKGDDKHLYQLAQRRRLDVWNRFAGIVGAGKLDAVPVPKRRPE